MGSQLLNFNLMNSEGIVEPIWSHHNVQISSYRTSFIINITI